MGFIAQAQPGFAGEAIGVGVDGKTGQRGKERNGNPRHEVIPYTVHARINP
jgi:hypothetical protein